MATEVQPAFLSYCRADSEFVLRLAEDLKSAGANVWVDQLDIKPGTPWDRAVEDALHKSSLIHLVLSPDSVNSDNVRDEVSFAPSKQKRVIPIVYRECDVAFRLARLQHIDFRADYARERSTLLVALGAQQGSHTKSPLKDGFVIGAPSQKTAEPVSKEGVAALERPPASAARAQEVKHPGRETDKWLQEKRAL